VTESQGSPANGAAVATAAPLDEVARSLYETRQKIYPREVHGLFAALRGAGVITLLGIYYGLAWIPWNGRQAVLLDLPARKFHVFGITFWPQDAVFLTLLLIAAALSLFFFTALAGRLWCGYACPQSVWTEVFLWIERLIEGGRVMQMRLDAAPLSGRKLRIKATKHLAWIAFSGFTGFTFVGYFTPIRELWQAAVALELGPWEAFWIGFYGLATYGNAGWLREQVCKYMCPYARFQGAMFDRDTLIVSYDPRRGEPRGHRRRDSDHRAADLGDCIDCGLCVQVCPTGIDIRDGLQYECIGCSACVDACNGVMDKMGYPKGLIRYTTENALAGASGRILRPRVAIYGAGLLVVLGALTWGIATRAPLALDVIRDRNQLYREIDDGRVENVYTLRILNMDERARRYSLSAAGIAGLELVSEDTAFDLSGGSVSDVVVRLRADLEALTARSSKVTFTIADAHDPALAVTEESRFLGPPR
jgi:cytochrome c oxidase accessory protein FixG